MRVATLAHDDVADYDEDKDGDYEAHDVACAVHCTGGGGALGAALVAFEEGCGD